MLGASFFGSSLYASDAVIEVEEVSKKRAATSELVRQDELSKKIKTDIDALSPLENEKRQEFVIKNRQAAKKYSTLAMESSVVEKKFSSYTLAAQLCDAILEKMGKNVDISDVRNAAITHFNVAACTTDLDAKFMSLVRSAYLFEDLLNHIGKKIPLQDVRNAAIAHYHVSKNTADHEMKTMYFDRAQELYLKANDIEIDSFWNF